MQEEKVDMGVRCCTSQSMYVLRSKRNPLHATVKCKYVAQINQIAQAAKPRDGRLTVAMRLNEAASAPEAAASAPRMAEAA